VLAPYSELCYYTHSMSSVRMWIVDLGRGARSAGEADDALMSTVCLPILTSEMREISRKVLGRNVKFKRWREEGSALLLEAHLEIAWGGRDCLFSGSLQRRRNDCQSYDHTRPNTACERSQ
jgi:hypothetical protein